MSDLFKKSSITPVVETMPADLLTPLAVYLKLSLGSENSFLLESVEGGENLARFSFIGSEPAFVVSGDDSKTEIRSGDATRSEPIGLFAYLRRHFDGRAMVDDVDGLPSFTGGAIGYLGFGSSGWFEPSLANRFKDPRVPYAEFMFFRSIVAFDHVKQTISLVSLVFSDEAEDDSRLEELYEDAKIRNSRLRHLLENGEISLTPTNSKNDFNEVRSNWSKTDFESAVSEIKDLINAGECYQVVLSQCFSKKTTADAVSIYRAIRSVNPSPYMFLLNFGDKAVVGASPEMLVRCSGRDLEYRPIAGTRPRGKTPDEDTALAAAMRADKKEVAEHLMLVDLGRNDLGRVAEYGSVEVKDLMSVEKYSHVQHLVSRITATLRSGLDRFDALAACFPAGTVSGAPKVRAIEIITDLEPTDRGVYSGAVGYFDYSGNMDTCIAIRTLVLADGVATVQAGAGIVADSVPESEFQETVNKARAMLKAIEMAESGRF